MQVTSPTIRKLALAHGLISFAYNTSILALVVNVVAGLLPSPQDINDVLRNLKAS